jgi:hypothetical protein
MQSYTTFVFTVYSDLVNVEFRGSGAGMPFYIRQSFLNHMLISISVVSIVPRPIAFVLVLVCIHEQLISPHCLALFLLQLVSSIIHPTQELFST